MSRSDKNNQPFNQTLPDHDDLLAQWQTTYQAGLTDPEPDIQAELARRRQQVLQSHTTQQPWFIYRPQLAGFAMIFAIAVLSWLMLPVDQQPATENWSDDQLLLGLIEENWTLYQDMEFYEWLAEQELSEPVVPHES